MIQNDEPIEAPFQDVLGRANIAAVIAGEMRDIDASRGAVVGILGPWGSGKTSLINLVRVELANEPALTVLDFNPWLFSGTDELIQNFFAELAEQLRLESGRLDSLADELERYGDVISPLQVLPVVGAWIERASGAGQALKKLRGKGQGGASAMRKRVADKLGDLPAPIVVVVDDVDRLRTDEIRDIFKLVRLTASFPNIIYVVAFDRTRVESALGEDGLPGRDYLEKIIQTTYDVPAVPEMVVRQQILDAVDAALTGLENPGPFAADRWPDVFEEVVRPLFRNMRDVRRYAAPLRGTVRSLNGRVALVDVLALEAVRIFIPDVFAIAAQHSNALTASEINSRSPAAGDTRWRQVIDSLLDVAGDRAEPIKALIHRVFPNAARFIERGWGADGGSSRWLRERRVAHQDVFRYYLERMASHSLRSFWAAEGAFQLIEDREALDDHFRSLDPSEWEGVVQTLESYEDEFPIAAAVPTSIVLLNLLPDIPIRTRSPFDFFDRRLIVTRVVLRLLQRLPDSKSVEAAVRQALPEVSTLSGKLTLLNIVGYEENLGHELIDLSASHDMETLLRQQIRAATPQQLSVESELFWMLTWTKKTSEPAEPQIRLSLTPPFACKLLKAAVSEETSQAMGTRSVRREQRLRWDALLDIVGGKDQIRLLIATCQDAHDDVLLGQATALAERYLEGWRPER